MLSHVLDVPHQLSQAAPSTKAKSRDVTGALFAVLFGTVIALSVHGYQFGRSNHTTYLLEPLRRVHPELYRNDWFMQETLQYHFAFTYLTEALMRLDILQVGFLAGYFILLAGLNLAWFRLVQAMGGGNVAYVTSVAAFYAVSGGEGMGTFEVFQDSSFLASNIAAVGLMWGFYFWITRRPIPAAVALGLAGLFHLNYAIVGGLFWCVAMLVDLWPARQNRTPGASHSVRTYLIASALLAVLISPCVAPAALRLLAPIERMPLAEYVELFVRQRGPHHYDPLSWTVQSWIVFLWPLPLAILGWRRLRASARPGAPPRYIADRSAVIVVFLLGLLVISFVGAGVWYVSETLIQMSLWRFSPLLKIFLAIGAATWIRAMGMAIAPRTRHVLAGLAAASMVSLTLLVVLDHVGMTGARAAIAHFPGRNWGVAVAMVASLAGCCVLAISPIGDVRARGIVLSMGSLAMLVFGAWGWGRWIHVTVGPQEPGYMSLCAWVADPTNTPVDAVFLVPPAEDQFRLYARRAIVVNYKAPPQSSSELIGWRDRMQTVLDMPTLAPLPHGFAISNDYIEHRYNHLTGEQQFAIARKTGASYIVVETLLEPQFDSKIVYRGPEKFAVYDARATN